jgi:hypothetical protein
MMSEPCAKSSADATAGHKRTALAHRRAAKRFMPCVLPLLRSAQSFARRIHSSEAFIDPKAAVSRPRPNGSEKRREPTGGRGRARSLDDDGPPGSLFCIFLSHFDGSALLPVLHHRVTVTSGAPMDCWTSEQKHQLVSGYARSGVAQCPSDGTYFLPTPQTDSMGEARAPMEFRCPFCGRRSGPGTDTAV